MSMHKIPLTDIERGGLKAHGLDIGTPSQLSDCFRQGVKWAQEQVGAQPAPVPESACRVCIYLHKGECGHSHGPLNPRGDYCGGQVLTSKAKMEPVQAQERKPLSDERIYELAGVTDRDEMMHRMARNIARAIEQAHGIKEQP